ncbi:MAG: response regulator [Candidatus Saganbacteria bacterium]|nr:response regulator [Candidatus Saganbacteria bacterium]
MKILIVDDEKALADMMALQLGSDKKYKVEVAYSGREGLAKVASDHFDLVITDYNMPGLDGEELLDAVKKIKPKLPVFIFSVYHDDDYTIDSDLRAKADAIISKPIDYDQLCKAIDKIATR